MLQFLFLINCFLFSFTNNMGDKIVAQVGNRIILHSEIMEQTQLLFFQENIDPSEKPLLAEKIYSTTLNNMIDQYIVLNVAENDTNIIISTEEVDRALKTQIDGFISRAGSEILFNQQLEEAGISRRQLEFEYWQNIKDMMLIEKYQFSNINNIDVSRVEVETFFKSFSDSIPNIPEKYTFSVIEIPIITNTNSNNNTYNFLLQLKQNIENNNLSFDSLAIIHSDDPGTSFSGGYLGFTPRGSLVKEYEKVAYSLLPGEISNPVKTEFGYHLIKLLDKQGEKISTQHILKFISVSDNDKKTIKDSLLTLINNIDKINFDSLAVIYSKKYKNYSGKYINIEKNNIPYNIIEYIENNDNYPKLTNIISLNDSYIVIYIYNYKKTEKTNLSNNWNTVYQYAKNNKQSIYFNNLIQKLKKDVYIKIY